jgi:hypothetical protein
LCEKGDKKMKSKKTKILMLALVTFVLVAGFNTAFVNALSVTAYSKSEPSSLGEARVSASDTPQLICPRIRIEKPLNGESFLEPGPLRREFVDIYVVDANGDPLDEATVLVHIFGEYDDSIWGGVTNDGLARWPKPKVDEDTRYRIKAQKIIGGENYETYRYVKILNRALVVTANPDRVLEGNEFFVKVTDHSGSAIRWAKVNFNGATKRTNSDGEVSFNAPYIDDDSKKYTITASKRFSGYDSGSSEITVINTGTPLPHRIYGEARDYLFNPVEGAKITVKLADGSTPSTYTDENGEYSIVVTPAEGGEKVTITASCDGCDPLKVKVEINSEESESTLVNFWPLGGEGSGGQSAPQGYQAQVQIQLQEFLNYQYQNRQI